MSTPYDEVRYPTFSHAQLHPDRLAIAALLFGLDPAPAESCRYLELGCGDAGTLYALGAALPGGELVGVDRARTALQPGREVCEQVGIANVTLVEADVADLPGLGHFDDVVCHGVFSWVPESAGRGILRACRQQLRPHVDFAAAPGLLAGTDLALGKAALHRLGQRWPAAVPFPELLAAARGALAPWRGRGEPDDGEELAKFLVRVQGARVVELRRHRRS